MLPAGLTAEALEAAAREPAPGSLAAAARLRARFGGAVAAAATTQVLLRREAATKFGLEASGMFFTRDGLEQATRPTVAAHHAAHFVAAGVDRVVDLGCGIGADARAFADAGLAVVAVEADPATYQVARANLVDRAEVILGDAVDLVDALVTPGTGVFCDPARRTGAGRVWRVENFRPPWAFVLTEVLGRGPVAGVQLGPALPTEKIPPSVAAEWVSDHGDTVEVGLWTRPGLVGGTRAAVLLPDLRLEVPDRPPALAVGPVRRFLYEPDGAVIRAGGVTVLGELLGASLLDPHIAYLTADHPVPTRYAAVFEVVDVLPLREPALRRWVREQDIGSLEIKKRGVDLDPAALRRRLRPTGSRSATLILTRASRGGQALVARRWHSP